MSTHLLALQLMAVQGILGAFDTLYHHELTESLPSRASARKELWIHAARAMFYSLLFVGLAAWVWNGFYALLLIAIFIIEIVLTLWDFVVEDKTRLLPATERVTHTILAINGGAFVGLLALNCSQWFYQPTSFTLNYHGVLSDFLILCGIGVGLSGIRDAFAAYQLTKNEKNIDATSNIKFSDTSESVLVTGGTGFIGQLLVRALLADGQRVTLLTRHPRKSAWLFNGRVTCIEYMDELPANYPIDIIINLAGSRILGWRWNAARKAILRKSRVELTKSIVAWVAKAHYKPKLLLSASAIGYYGIQAQGDNSALTEDNDPQPIFMSQLCSEWEAAAQTILPLGVSVALMRFGLVLGNQGSFPMLRLPIKLGLGGALGSGRQWMSWIHITDLLRGIAHLWKLHSTSEPNNPTKNIYNFTAPESLTQYEFSKCLAGILRRPCFFPTPGWPMRLALGEQSDLLLEGQRVTPTNLIKNGFVFHYPDAESALRNLC